MLIGPAALSHSYPSESNTKVFSTNIHSLLPFQLLPHFLTCLLAPGYSRVMWWDMNFNISKVKCPLIVTSQRRAEFDLRVWAVAVPRSVIIGWFSPHSPNPKHWASPGVTREASNPRPRSFKPTVWTVTTHHIAVSHPSAGDFCSLLIKQMLRSLGKYGAWLKCHTLFRPAICSAGEEWAQS